MLLPCPKTLQWLLCILKFKLHFMLSNACPVSTLVCSSHPLCFSHTGWLLSCLPLSFLVSFSPYFFHSSLPPSVPFPFYLFSGYLLWPTMCHTGTGNIAVVIITKIPAFKGLTFCRNRQKLVSNIYCLADGKNFKRELLWRGIENTKVGSVVTI